MYLNYVGVAQKNTTESSEWKQGVSMMESYLRQTFELCL